MSYIQLDPENPDYYLNRAMARNLGNQQQAIELSKVLEYNPLMKRLKI